MQAAAGSASITDALNDDTLVEVLHVANPVQALAITNRRICSLARATAPSHLRVEDEEHAEVVLTAPERCRPFTGCTQLYVAADSPTSCVLAVGILNTAQQWTGLQQLELQYMPKGQQLQQGPPLRHLTFSLLSGVQALQQLRRLVLSVPSFGAGSARLVQQLVHLTSLVLGVTPSPAAAAAGVAAAVGEDLSALAAMSRLVELKLEPAPDVQPAASPNSPSFLPSSLTWLHVSGQDSAAAMARWLTHLQGCPGLRQLQVDYSGPQHGSAHPSAVAQLVAQHNEQLQTLAFEPSPAYTHTTWDLAVDGLPAVGAADKWRPDAALATLTGLQRLSARFDGLVVDSGLNWEHLVSLSALTALESIEIMVPLPQQPVGLFLALLELTWCTAHLSGHQMGQLLLACAVLQKAQVEFGEHSPPTLQELLPIGAAAGNRLPRHPTLQEFSLDVMFLGEDVASEFACLAPVINGVASLDLLFWANSHNFSSSYMPGAGLPDLSLWTQLTSLRFSRDSDYDTALSPPEQENYVAMVAPLVQLQRLEVELAWRLNARAVLLLQYSLPQLSYVKLRRCGKRIPLAAGDAGQQQHVPEGGGPLQQEGHVLAKVRQLLRAGLVLEVED